MTYEERVKAQLEMDNLAKGYEDTVVLIKRCLNKKYEQLKITFFQKEKNQLQVEITMLKGILKENSDIIRKLKNYYGLHNADADLKNDDEEGHPFTINEIVDIYVKGGFN